MTEVRPNTTCPVCGKSNQCVPARTGTFTQPCWCENITIDAERLARIPEAARGEACLCPACAGLARPPEGAPDEP